MPKYRFPKGWPYYVVLARAFQTLTKPLNVISYSMKKFKGTYSAPLGGKRVIVTQDPEFVDFVLRKNHRNYIKSPVLTESLGKFIGNGLLTSNGDFWLRQRKLIQPGFHIRKIQALYKIVQHAVDEFLPKVPTGASVDMYPLMNQLAFEVVIKSLFNVAIPSEKVQELGEFISEAQSFVIKEVRVPGFIWLARLMGREKKHLQQAQEAREMIRGIINQRKQSQSEHHDLLDMLLNVRYEDTGEPMEEEQLIDEILILIVAGHETTANSLSWILYLLAEHPQVLTELKSATKDLSLEETIKSPLLNAVIKEGMRLYPPAWISDRMALTDDTFKSYFYPKDTMVITFFYGMHRDKAHWENPEAFDPNRFMPENAKKINSKVYHPFGAGPRSCIGNNFAMAEMAVFLKSFIQQYDLQSIGYQPKEEALITLRPDKVLVRLARNK